MKRIITILLLTTLFQMQGQISVGVFADAKLLFIGDGNGNDAGTLDLIVLPKLQNNGVPIFVYPYFEYANLNGGNYIRYALGVGYGFEVKNISIEPSIDYGRIVRWGGAYSSFNGLLEVSYKMRPKTYLSVLNSLTQRNDLAFKWEDKAWRYNFYFGARYEIY